jgi:hypothetical protein
MPGLGTSNPMAPEMITDSSASPPKILNPIEHRKLLLLWMKLDLPVQFKFTMSDPLWQDANLDRLRGSTWVENLSDPAHHLYDRYVFRLAPHRDA